MHFTHRLLSVQLAGLVLASTGLLANSLLPADAANSKPRPTNAVEREINPGPAVRQANQDELQASVDRALANFRQEVRGAQQVLDNADGLLVFPSVYEGGFVVAAEYGRGLLLGPNGQSVMGHYRLTSGSVGWQAGAQKKTLIIAFMTPESLQNFRNSEGWDISAEAAATIAVVGAEGSISAATLNRPIVAFAIDQAGLMGGLRLEGTKITKVANP